MNTEHGRQQFGTPASVFAQDTLWRAYMDDGLAAHEAGRYAEAEKLLQFAVAEAEKFGPSDLRLAISFNNLAIHYGEQGK